jgi:hypothetical protein
MTGRRPVFPAQKAPNPDTAFWQNLSLFLHTRHAILSFVGNHDPFAQYFLMEETK